MNDLIPLHDSAHLVTVYNRAIEDLETAFGLIKQTKLILKNTLGEYRDDINRYSRYNSERFDREIIKKNFWKYIVDKTGLRALLSTKKLEELEKQLSDDSDTPTMPEVTEENIFNFLQANIEQAGDLVNEAIREVFEFLTPQAHPWGSDYKTNNHEEIGEKVILEYYIPTDKWGYTSINHYRESNLNAIDKLFHLIDGQGVPKYPSTLVTSIRTAIDHKENQIETQYFRAKWFKKGTLHLEFKRLDLVKEINKRVGGSTIKKAA